MASLDLSLHYSGDISEWTILGISQDIFSLMLDIPDLPVTVLPSFWSTNHQIYRIGQCTSHDGFLPWSIIKASLGLPKQGRTPTWVSWLTSTYNHPLTQISDMPTTRSMVPTTDRRRKEWVSFLSDDNTVLVGKISSKSLSAN